MAYFIHQQSSLVVLAFGSLVPKSFYVRNPRDSLLADEGSTSLRSNGRLSDKETVNAGRKSCASHQIRGRGWKSTKRSKCIIGQLKLICSSMTLNVISWDLVTIKNWRKTQNISLKNEQCNWRIWTWKDLGVIMNDQADFKDHIDKAVYKPRQKMGWFWELCSVEELGSWDTCIKHLCYHILTTALNFGY